MKHLTKLKAKETCQLKSKCPLPRGVHCLVALKVVLLTGGLENGFVQSQLFSRDGFCFQNMKYMLFIV